MSQQPSLDEDVAAIIEKMAVRYRDVASSFDQCWPASCSLAGQLAEAGHRIGVLQVVGDLFELTGGDPRWDEIPHADRHHYIVLIAGEVVDLTARQFDARVPCPLVYPAGEVSSRWSDAYDITPSAWQREFRSQQHLAHQR